MATFVFVHGTFATNANWPKLQDGLAQIGHASGNISKFEQLLWNGNNRVEARQAAAFTILALLQQIRLTSADEKIFLIGHSHGGSAVAYFLKQYSEAARTLSGCAFLSTPFVAMRSRKDAVRLIPTLSLFPLIGGSMLLGAWVPPIFAWCGEAVLVAMTLLLYWIIEKASTTQSIVEEINRGQTAEMPDGNYLFLRCAGDEAAAALSAAQFTAWLGTKASHILELITRPLRGSYIFLFLTVIAVSIVFHGDLPNVGRVYQIISDAYSSQGFLWLTLYSLNVLVVIAIGSVTVLFVFGCVGGLLIFSAQALTSWAFGWTRLSTGFLVELAIEPLPFGVHSLANIDWNFDSGVDGIVHSWTYAHPVAIGILQNWVKSTLLLDAV